MAAIGMVILTRFGMRHWLLVLFLGLLATLAPLASAVPGEDSANEEEYDEGESDSPPPEGPPLRPLCEVTTSYGYKCEEHQVTTEDGYILDMFHLICDKAPKKPTILFIHGLLASAEIYVLNNKSVAYQLCDQGNDVWLGNLRTTFHGRKHKTLDPDKDEKFWATSYGDMAIKDVPAQIKYVVEKSKSEKIFYYGHSMGTTVYFLMMNAVPDVKKYLKEALLMAPVGYANKFKGMVKEGSSMYDMMVETMNGFKEKKLWEAFPRADVPANDHQIRCNSLPEMGVGYCNMAFEMAKPVVGDFLPAGTSTQNLEHFSSSYLIGKVGFYDYKNEEKNKEKYGSPKPPEVDFKKVDLKTHLFWCEGDHVVSPPDVDLLKGELPNLGETYFVDDEDFNHVDFINPMSEDTEEAFDALMVKVKSLVLK